MNDAALPAMPVPSDSLWSRLRTTPLRDAFRGRLTASLDFRRVIVAAGLPEPLSGVIYMTVRRARLWRSERMDVARELANHFRDGTDAGRMPEQLVKSFGDPRKAARLIRRAKLRNRPLAWRAWRRTWRAVAILILLLLLTYIVQFLRLVTAHPTISRNYGLEMNAPARAVPENDRAWPQYREALLHLTAEPKLAGSSDGDVLADKTRFWVATEKPAGKHWGIVAAWLKDNREAIELARKASTRPHLAFVYGDPADKLWLIRIKFDAKRFDLGKNAPNFDLSLAQVDDLRNVLTLIQADAHRAAFENDGTAFVRDIEAAIGLAGQLHDDMPLLVTDLVAFNMLSQALTTVNETVAERPQLLSEADLKRLAHAIAGFAGGTIRCRLSGERLLFQDLYQRIYTDNGNGDGRLTLGGLSLIERLITYSTSDSAVRGEQAEGLRDYEIGPILSTLMLSRRPMTELTESMFDRAESECSRPLWQWTHSSVDADLKRWHSSRIDRVRFYPLLLFMPAFQSAFFASERLTQQRDATLVALGLELFHRQHGSWPKKLDELVPDLLPAVPSDRFTGGPLLYRIVDGRPLLYSAGPDKKDDGGRPIEGPFYPMFFTGVTEGKVATGDWILWPPQTTAKMGE